MFSNISECVHHSCGYWQCDLSEALVQSHNFWSDLTFCRKCGMGRTVRMCRSTALLLLVIYLWLMAHYKTLF